MFKLAFATAFLALAALAQGPTITTPAAAVTCQPSKISWSGGQPPYWVSVIPAGQTGAEPIANLVENTQSTEYSWTVNLPAGSNISLSVRDGTGDVQYSSPIVIQQGSDTSCLNGEGGGGGAGSASGSAAPSSGSAAASSTEGGAAASSEASSGSSAPASSAASSGSQSSAAPSSARPTSASGGAGAASSIASQPTSRSGNAAGSATNAPSASASAPASAGYINAASLPVLGLAAVGAVVYTF